MILSRLSSKRDMVLLGINSGTSMDGLDLAAVKITRNKFSVTTKFLQGTTIQFPRELKSALFILSESSQASVSDILLLDQAFGQWIGESASRFIEKLQKKKITVDAVASHGQTIRHLPKKQKRWQRTVNGTWQIGSISHIARATGLITVGDFRQGDIAIGGEGAPITTSAMRMMFSDKRESRLIVNIGGMSNYFLFPSATDRFETEAADCGPGNALSDTVARELFEIDFDKNGAIASRGIVHDEFCRQLLPRLKTTTRSTGREQFGESAALLMIALGKRFRLSKQDILANVSMLTVIAISRAVASLKKRYPHLRKLYLTGGGRKNNFFREQLQTAFPQMTVSTIDQLGIDGDYVEAAAYAVMGEACLRSVPMRTPGSTKRSLLPISGIVAQPPQPIKSRIKQ